MKILFVQPPHYYEGKTRRPAYFPIGLGYLAAPLLAAGHHVEVFDIWAEQASLDQVKSKLPGLEYDVVGITALSTQYSYVKWLANELKHVHEKPVVLGGPLATFSADTVLEHTLVDVCAIGEGDITFPALLAHLDSPEQVPGIVFRKNGAIVHNEPRNDVKDLDSLGFPIRDPAMFATEVYLREAYILDNRGLPTMNVTTNRGCPYHCSFCSRTFAKVRSWSAQHVRSEIEQLVDQFGVQAINFNDELFVLSKRRAYELCDVIKPLNIIWSCQARVNTVDEDLLKCMKDAGCVEVGLGIESGSQRILKAMNKQITTEQSLNAMRAAKKAGLAVNVQCIFGYPGECDETIAENIAFFAKARSQALFFTLTPMPGSPLYEECQLKKMIADEDAYLASLDSGYMGFRELLLNFTDFPADQFYVKKEFLENRILINYLLRNPRAIFSDRASVFHLIRALGSKVPVIRRLIEDWDREVADPFASLPTKVLRLCRLLLRGSH